MKLSFFSSMFVFVVMLLLMELPAWCDGVTSEIPWQEYPGIVDSAVNLKAHAITIYIKNVSATSKRLLTQGTENFVKCYYINNAHALILLGEHSLYNDHRDDSGGGALSLDLLSGSSTSEKLELTSDERDELNGHLIIFHLVVYDPATKERFYIECHPKMLTKASK